jgi:hypothetical protein
MPTAAGTGAVRHQRLFFIVVIGALLAVLAVFAVVVLVLGDDDDQGATSTTTRRRSRRRTWSWSGQPRELDRDIHAGGGRAGVDAADRLDVTVVAAGGHHDVPVVRLHRAGHDETGCGYVSGA